jgi:ribosomal protein S4
VRDIEQVNKELAAENELLYEKFNGELARIVAAVKGKGLEGKEELVAKLHEVSEDLAREKKENALRKRQVISLRASLAAATRDGGGAGAGG